MAELINAHEMYLKAVLELEEIGVGALRTQLGKRLNQAPSTVSQTVTKMLRDGLFVAVPGDRQIYLSGDGRRAALDIMRKHRLAECFLEQVVGLEWPFLNREACLIEHAMSSRVTELMAQKLGDPEFSPYGNRIPTTEEIERGFSRSPGTRGLLNALRFTFETSPQSVAVLRYIGEAVQLDTRLLATMERSGLKPGATMFIKRHGPAVRLCAAGFHRTVEFDHELAASLFVEASDYEYTSGPEA